MSPASEKLSEEGPSQADRVWSPSLRGEKHVFGCMKSDKMENSGLEERVLVCGEIIASGSVSFFFVLTA
jgi:hypothetical protein